LSFKEKIFRELDAYLLDPFGYVDNLKIEFRGWDFNILKESKRIRKLVFVWACIFAVVWLVMGFDSGVGQINFPLEYAVKQLLEGQPIDFSEMARLYHWAYGKYMHWSVFTIYGLSFWGLSRYLENRGVKGSQNFAYSLSMTLLSIGVFEWFWMGSYYIFQNQPWILKPQYPQLKLLLQNTGLTFIGILALIQIRLETRFKPRIDVNTLVLLSLACVSCLMWIQYPYPIKYVHVETSTGLWVNSRYFPQTVYTVDVDPTDEINAGDQFFLEDNMIHLFNTVAKVFVTLAVMSFGFVVPKRYKYLDIIPR